MKNTLSAIFIASGLALFAGEAIPSEKQKTGLTKKNDARTVMRQTTGEDNNTQAKGVIKMNLTQLIFRNLSFQAEYGFHKNMSGALGFNVLIPRSVPGFFAKEDPTGEGLRDTRFTGWAFTPEFRFYPGAKTEYQAPHGFYIAPYLRIAKYRLTSSFYVYDGSEQIGYSLDATYGGATGGLMIGSQWLIGKHFSFDLWIAGLGFGFANFSMEAVGKNITLDDPQRARLKEAVEMVINDARFIDGEVHTTSNSANVDFRGLPMSSVRALGFCIGFAF